ncbi:MAG: 3-beta hydroxysteroid dehydrogenase [Rhizobiales bacterium 65-9]|nr:NAD(P)-dependent oxidoreductase [Hyphomicrobiales bacterium]OJY35368.1 MAG: 3-beta hydroxysteroid dehydrogenase [Rhizobiales bacterium 65-9]
MKVALIGATGFIGSRILSELVRRGHAVTAIVRNPEKVPASPGVVAAKGNALDKDALAALLKGHDAAVSAVHFTASDPVALIGAVKASGVKRYIVVGGAGSLEIASGARLVDSPQFPPAYKAEALKGGEFLDLLRKENDLNWTFFSPAAMIEPGERTGRFRLGGDRLLTDAKGDSRISAEDYAIALVDELEAPKHERARFTIAY